MFVVIYKWQLKPGKESEFRDAWRQATESIYATRGSLGSQLMKGQDGTYYGVPRWPDRDSGGGLNLRLPILKRAASWEN